MHITLPQAVAIVFSASPPEWRVRAVQKLQSALWDDRRVTSKIKRMNVYIDNLRAYKVLRAADADIMFALVDSLSHENGLRADYDARLAEAAVDIATAPDDDEEDAEIDGGIVAPEDVM